MRITRRQFLQAAATSPLLATTPPLSHARTGQPDTDNPIKVGSILDVSGIFGLYGRPMDKAVSFAIEEINNSGGLLGRALHKVAYDTRSDLSQYPRFAQKITREDQVDVVHAGILSASREAIRPILREQQTLYFYNVQYEGGVCDRNTFCTGVTPTQQAAVLVPECMQLWGKTIYVVAANYNYGQITARWIEHYATLHGGKVIQTEYFDLDTDDFSSAVDNIKDAGPDMVISVLVGGPHLSFYRQWEVAGMKTSIPIASTTMGSGNEHAVLTPEQGDGIRMVYSFSRELDTPANRQFLHRWQQRFGHVDDLNELAVATYQGIHLWANGVRDAGTLERLSVIEALEADVSHDGPTGRISIDGPTHHTSTTVHLVEVANHKMNVINSFEKRDAMESQSGCDLHSNPNETRQFEHTG